jgi:hypothetical protein
VINEEMSKHPTGLAGWIRRNYIIVILFMGISLPMILFVLYGLTLLIEWNSIDDLVKSTAMEIISGGTLSLGALSLAVLSYSFSQMHSSRTSLQKAPYRRLAIVAFMITSISLTDTFVSLIFLLTKAPFSFEMALILLLALIFGVIIMVNLWTLEEFFPRISKNTETKSFD